MLTTSHKVDLCITITKLCASVQKQTVTKLNAVKPPNIHRIFLITYVFILIYCLNRSTLFCNLKFFIFFLVFSHENDLYSDNR